MLRSIRGSSAKSREEVQFAIKQAVIYTVTQSKSNQQERFSCRGPKAVSVEVPLLSEAA
jgi:hypothetical protein